MTISPLLAPAFTFVLIFTLEFPFLEKLRLIAVSVAAYLPPRASARTRRTRLDSGLDLQSPRHGLVVVHTTTPLRTAGVADASFHIRLDLQATRHCLVVVGRKSRSGANDDIAVAGASFHIRFDFHRCFSFH